MSKSILLVEDDEANQTLMKMALKTAGIECKLNIAQYGEEALSFLRSHEHPDLVFLDLNLPGKSGIEILSEIKSDENLKQIPVVVLTGSDFSTDIQACSEFPQCRYILKPSRFDELVAMVKSLDPLK